MSDLSPHPRRDDLVSSTVGSRVEALFAAAEHEAERVSAEVEAKAAQRAVEIVAAAQADAERLRQEATRRVDDYLAASRRRIDAYAAARLERLAELTEGLIEASETIHHRLHDAISIRNQLNSVIQAIGVVAETTAKEASQPPPSIPPLPSEYDEVVRASMQRVTAAAETRAPSGPEAVVGPPPPAAGAAAPTVSARFPRAEAAGAENGHFPDPDARGEAVEDVELVDGEPTEDGAPRG
jgi:hypothetical protein